MSLKSKNGKKYYYIIQGANISKKHRDLENHMIDHFFYKNLNWDEHRVALQEQINSFYTKYGKSFCKKNGEDEIYYDLTSSINNTENTIIYSIEKKRLDCFLLFNEKMDENKNPYIYIIFFCANQVFPTKKGGLFFEHFLDSLRGQYEKIRLSPWSNEDNFFKSFHFEDIEGVDEEDKDKEYIVDLIRTLSPISDKNRRRKPIDYLLENEAVIDSHNSKFKKQEITSLKNYKFEPYIKKDYYIIPSNKKYKTRKLQMLEKYMIAKRNYKIHESYNRTKLIKKIKSYFSFITGDFCYSSTTDQGGLDTDILVHAINNEIYTVIYSIENNEIDCVIVFCDNKSEISTIEVEAFCSNQTIKTKKGGIFFAYFLNTLRGGKYKNIKLYSAADKFYESFYFSINKYSTTSKPLMTRTLSPKSGRNRTRKQHKPYTIPGDVKIKIMPSRVKSARTSRTRINRSKRTPLSI
jgi:hypothetical protein